MSDFSSSSINRPPGGGNTNRRTDERDSSSSDTSGSGWRRIGPGRWAMVGGGDNPTTDRAADTRRTDGDSAPPRRRWQDDFDTDRSERSSGGSSWFSGSKRAGESLGKDGPVANTSALRTRVGQAVAPTNPRLFPGAQVKFKDQAEVFTFVGYNTQGHTLLRSNGGSEQSVRDAAKLELLPNQTFRSVVETLTPNGRLYTARPEQVAEFDRLLARKVGSGSGTVREVVDAVRDAGFEALLVGGAVRDVMLGRQARDVDLSTTMWVEDVRAAAEKKRVSTGRTITQFGTIKVGFGTNELDVVTLKRASGEFGLSLAEDVGYRDFSINQLFYDPASTLIIDPTGYGVPDVLSKTLRPAALPGQEQQWLRDNPSAVVRLFKFTLRGFTPTPELLQLVKDNFVRSVARLDGVRRSAMLSSVDATKDEVVKEMRRLGFTDEHVKALYPFSDRPRRDDDEDDRPWRRSNVGSGSNSSNTPVEWPPGPQSRGE